MVGVSTKARSPHCANVHSLSVFAHQPLLRRSSSPFLNFGRSLSSSMEPAKIDWKRIDSRFVEDCVYEHINAPKWVDFLAIEDSNSIDDEAWFCRPDCKHPKTAEDFLKTTPSSKLARSANGCGSGSLPLREWNQGDAKMKRRGQTQSSVLSTIDPTFNEDSENQNPNLSTPQNQQAKSLKAAIKSSSEKKKPIDGEISQSDEMPRLKSTLSARNLFAGRDILNHITEFCNELKKLATRARERESEEKLSGNKRSQEAVLVKKVSGHVLGELEVSQKERKPLLEMGKEKLEGMEKGSAKERARRKKSGSNAEAENIPVSLNLENVKHKGEERLLQIRTNPPSPQCFSTPHAPVKATPSKASRSSRLTERGILQEVKQNKEMKKDEQEDKPGSVSSSIITNVVDGRQARALDVFWFLKPCTLSE